MNDPDVKADKEYSSSYYNYHRNCLMFLIVTAFLLYYEIKPKLGALIYLDDGSLPNGLAENLPIFTFISGTYCLILFFVEWKFQSFDHLVHAGEIIRKIEISAKDATRDLNETMSKLSNAINHAEGVMANIDRKNPFPINEISEIHDFIYASFKNETNAVTDSLSTALLRSEDIMGCLVMHGTADEASNDDVRGMVTEIQSFIRDGLMKMNFVQANAQMAPQTNEMQGFSRIINQERNNEIVNIERAVLGLKEVSSLTFKKIDENYEKYGKHIKFLLIIKSTIGGFPPLVLLWILDLAMLIFYLTNLVPYAHRIISCCDAKL